MPNQATPFEILLLDKLRDSFAIGYVAGWETLKALVEVKYGISITETMPDVLTIWNEKVKANNGTR